MNASGEEDFTRRERYVVGDGEETDVTESVSDVRGSKLRHDKHGPQGQGVAAGNSSGKGTVTFSDSSSHIFTSKHLH